MGRLKQHGKKVAAAVATAAATVALLPAGAAIGQPPPFTTTCTNPGGNEVQGQCQGNPHTQQNVNPAGHAPPGQNK